MESSEVLRLVQRSGFNAKVRGEEVLIEVCAYCGNQKWNLELNGEKGVFSCWACRASGTLEHFLLRFTGEHIHIPVNIEGGGERGRQRNPLTVQGRRLKPAMEVGSAAKYLAMRGLTYRDCHTYNISVCVEPDDPLYGRILFPVHEYWTGAEIGHVARKYATGQLGTKYLNVLDEREIVGFRTGGIAKVHVLVEGVFGALMVNKAGYQAAALLGIQIGDTLAEWAALVPPEELILVLLDGDAQDIAVRLTRRIKMVHKCAKNIKMDGPFDPADLDPVVLKKLIERTRHNGI